MELPPPIVFRSNPVQTVLSYNPTQPPYTATIILGNIEGVLTEDTLLYIARFPVNQSAIVPTEWVQLERYPTGNGLFLGPAWDGAEWRIADTGAICGNYRAFTTNYEGQPDYWYGYSNAPVFAVEVRREGGLPATGNGFLQLVNQ